MCAFFSIIRGARHTNGRVSKFSTELEQMRVSRDEWDNARQSKAKQWPTGPVQVQIHLNKAVFNGILLRCVCNVIGCELSQQAAA